MKKHVLVLCLLGNPYQKAEGGFNKTVNEIIEYFKNKDIIITIITSNTTIEYDSFQQKYININFWELALEPEWINDQDQLYTNIDYILCKIQQIVSDSNYQISLIHSLQWINGYLAVKYNLPKKAIHIHSIISSSFERKASGFSVRSQYQRLCEDITFQAADLLLSITEAEKLQLINYYHISSSKILVIGRTADLYYKIFHNIHISQISKDDKIKYNSSYIEKSISWNQKVFVYVGRLIEYKGIREIIKAWYLLYLKYQEIMPPLWIIGGAENKIYQFRETLVEEIPSLTECESKHKIYWWGYMEHYGISTIFQRAHVLLMHSAFEPGGRVILEAMSAGRPIIATPTGFAQTYIKDWYNGFQVEYKDIHSLSIYMEFFIKNEYLSSMLGINAQNTYNTLSDEWQYYIKLDNLYHLGTIKNKTFTSPQISAESHHPLLVDDFPYCDIKNDFENFSEILNSPIDAIEEITGYRSYLWQISLTDEVYLAKQVYNRLNLAQLWNVHDSQKIHTIWMQYYTAVLSANYKCIIAPFIKSEKIFTYLLPYYTILPDEQVLKKYPILLNQLANYENGICENHMLPAKQMQFFKDINKSIQNRNKHYTINIYAYELKIAFEEKQTLYQDIDIVTIKSCFEKVNQFISLRENIEYGLNYGKSFLKHTIIQDAIPFLLPSSDIFVGELGQDEGILFMEYFLERDILLKNTFYSRKAVLIWCLLHCMELFISSKILCKSCSIISSDLQRICDEINTEK